MTTGDILPSKVLLKRFAKKEKVVGTIIIPETAGKDPNLSGSVCLIGSNVQSLLDTTRPLKINDTVLFNPHSCQTVRINDEDYLLADCKELLFYFTPES
jgi:co-chaperonin GroES (HSP10)